MQSVTRKPPGLFQRVRVWAAQRRYAPHRESLAYPKLVSLQGQNRVLGTPKPTPSNLRYFSRTIYARRAINSIKDPIAALDWEVGPIDGATADEHQCEILKRCLDQPNSSDSFRSLIEQCIEDLLVNGAGVLEQQITQDAIRPVWLWPVDTTTIRPIVAWDGNPLSDRFIQGLGYTGGSILSELNAKKFPARDIIYMRLNPSSESPFGYGPLEIAYDSISWKLGVGRFAASKASNAQPENFIYAGQTATMDELLAFRAYWRNEVEGQGQTPLLAGPVKPEVLKLHPGGDEALYLKWQEFLIREIATAFSLSPQNFSLERDVNRSTAEVAEDRDWNSAIKPLAHLVAEHLTRDLLHGRLGLMNVEFRFKGLNRVDESAEAETYERYYRAGALTPNEQRAKLGMEPLKGNWGEMTYGELQIAIAAAKSAASVNPKVIEDE